VKCWIYQGEKVPDRGTKPKGPAAAGAVA